MSLPIDYRRYPILYVDDEPNNLVVFETVFGEGFTVRVAQTPARALEILDAEPVAVVLLDQRMPEMSGVVLAERVRHRHPEVDRMIVTAYSDAPEAVEAINRGGVSQWIHKPWEAEEVAAILRGAIERRALREMVGDLQAKMVQTERLALLGVATASVAHDLRSPLTVIRVGLGHLAELLAGRPEDDEAMALLRELEGACEQMSGLVTTVGTHAQAPRQRRQRLTLEEVLTSILPLCRGEIERRARLRVEVREAPTFDGDPVGLGQVLLNLLVNAGQAIPAGRREDHEVRVVTGRDQGQAILEVHDTGEGIPPSRLEAIFEPFVTTRGEAGTGLGLAIVRQTVEAHGGRIEVKSRPGIGTSFIVHLPLG